MSRFRRYFQFKDGHRPSNEAPYCINFLLLTKHETAVEFRDLYFRCGPGVSVGITTELRPGRSEIESR